MASKYTLVNNMLSVISGKYGVITIVAPPSTFVEASGGTEIYDGNYRVHTYTSLATGSFVVTNGGDVSVFILAGGGGGGNCAPSNQRGGAGGGAGGFILCTSTLAAATYSLQIGSGGPRVSGSLGKAGTDGSTSIAFGMTAIGGGGGGTYNGKGRTGGSGGGSGVAYTTAGGDGTAGQGFAGGKSGGDGFQKGGGSGGGATGVGGDGLASNQPAVAGPGKNVWGKLFGTGGRGAWGQLNTEPTAVAGTGNGGNGGGNDWGAAGSSGTIIVKYKYQDYAYPTDHIALYKFEDNMLDDTNTYNLTAGTGTFTYQAGKINRGIKCTTANQCRMYNASLVPGTTWTMNFWHKQPTPTDSDITCGTISGNNRTGNIRTTSGTGVIYGFCNANGGWQSLAAGTTNYCDGNWHLINYYRNGTTFGISVDNGTVYTATYSTVLGSDQLNINNGPMGVGSIAAEYDQFRFFNRVLTTDEVTQLWNSGNGI
jgi:hypothetical protein